MSMQLGKQTLRHKTNNLTDTQSKKRGKKSGEKIQLYDRKTKTFAKM